MTMWSYRRKNGALDFQPSEPAQPLFGSMKYTSLMPELQITQEYTQGILHIWFIYCLCGGSSWILIPIVKEEEVQ